MFQITWFLFVALISFEPLSINTAVLFKRIFAALATSWDAKNILMCIIHDATSQPWKWLGWS